MFYHTLFLLSKSKHYIITILILLQSPLLSYAAGPMMHVVLGEYWIAQYAPEYNEEQKKLFLLGTVFPDIRYLGTIKRYETHYKNVSLQKIKNEASPFHRGVLFHSFVDERRDQWIRKNQVEQKIKELKNHKDTFLKLIEDQSLYSQHSWGTFRHFLLTIPSEEKTYDVDDKTLAEWHSILMLYFTLSPETLLIQYGMLQKDMFNIKAVDIKQWMQLLPEYTKRKEMQDHVQNLMEALKQEINEA